MKPILFPAGETSFLSNGLGVLSDAITCKVTEERNGAFELNMSYPITGIHYDSIALRSLILAKPNKTSDTQPFRVYRITKPINGIVEIYAEHISYDLSGIPVQPFSSSTVIEAFVRLKSNAVTACPFTFITDKSTEATMTVSAPCSIRSQLAGKSGSILDVYGGGEYEFDRFTVKLYQNRGMNRGVSIRYGKNLIDLKQEQNCNKVYTGVYPFWIDSQTGAVTQLTEKIVNVTGIFDFTKILVLDLSSEWQEAPTQLQLQTKTETYIENNGIGVPEINLTLSFAQLEDTEEYKGRALLERVSLCDTVNVYFDKLGVNATAKVIKVVYDCLLDRVDSVELGNSKTSLTDSLLSQETAIKEVPSRNDVAAMIDLLTAEILGADGGAVRLLDTNGDGEPDTLYIADNPDPAQAVKVWRFNYLGWGASSNGYNGSFTLGASLSTGIVADFITAGILNAGLIKAGILQDDAGTNYWNMQTGELKIASNTKVGSGSDTISSLLENLQNQIDGQIETWYYDYVPTLLNAPASNWETDEEKNNHIGDLFYYKSTGYCYRFMLDDNTYKWVRISDEEIATALANAAAAQDTADHKRRVFVDTPTVPYDVGDLWAQGSTGDILTCMTAKTSAQSYSSSDWVKRNKYTDDTAVTALNAFLNQQEIFNRLTNNGTVEGIYLENGHLYINASYIATGTITDVNENNSWDLNNGILRISGSTLVGEDGTETTIGGMATRISSVEQSVTPEGIVSVVRSAPLYYQDLNKERNYALNSDKYLLYNAGKLYVESVEQSSLRYKYDLSSNLYADSNNANLVLRVSFDMKRTNIPANTEYLEVQIVYRNSSGQGYNRSSKVKSEEIITDNDWTHTRYGRFDFSEDDVASFVCMRIVFTAELQCQIEIKNVKVEVSDTYTAWCPAIEDNTGFYNRISSAEQRISDTGIVTIVQSQGGVFRDGTSGKLVSMIGQTAEEITIDAEQIQIGGYTYGNADVQGGVPGALYTGGQLQAPGVSTSTGLSATNTDWAFWAGSGKFRVAQSGALTAKNATLQGTLITTHWALLSAGLGYFTDASSPSNSKFAIGYSASGNVGTVGDGHHNSDCILAGRYIQFSTTGGSLQITHVDGMNDLCFVPAGISANIGAKDIPFDALYGKKFVTVSSRKVKHDIHSLGNVGNIIDQLTPVSFKYNGTEEKSFGLILEDTIEILPEICDAPSENDTSGGGGIKYTELIPILLAEVKALRQRIAQLEKIANGGKE